MLFRFFHLLLFLFLLQVLQAQPAGSLSRKSVSRPEKIWAYTHPFVAKKAWHVTHRVMQVLDSVKRSNSLGSDLNGGSLDAFKHATWMCLLSAEIGARKAKRLGDAHERGNYLQFKKHQTEDAFIADSLASEMDLRNNAFGRQFALDHPKASTPELIQGIVHAVLEGKLTQLKKSDANVFLRCDGTVIRLSDYRGKWYIPKCLVPSGK